MKVDYSSFTKKILLKENSTENLAEKNLKENSKFNELWNFSVKQKKKKQKTKKEKKKEKKRKYSNSKNFSPNTLSDKFPANCTKIATLYLSSLGSIPSHVIPNTFKMVLDTSWLNIKQYKVHIKGKVEQLRERSSALPHTSV